VSQRKPYPSDLSDARWALIEPTLTAWRKARLDRRPTGQPARVELREVFNAILYVNRTGIAWKYMPHDFPAHGTVYAYYAAWRDEGIFAQLNYDLTGLARVKEGRKPEPTASVIDTQSVKTSTNVPLTSQGTDAAKKIVGRKRGILTDTLGLLLAVIVTAASLSENAVGIQLLDQAKKTYPTISKSWVDTGFKKTVVEHGANLGIDVEVVARKPGVPGFHVVKRRWVVERSLGWIMMRRRLARDYETLPASSEAMIHIASIDNLTKRITDETTPTWRGTY
jgi:transposase